MWQVVLYVRSLQKIDRASAYDEIKQLSMSK